MADTSISGARVARELDALVRVYGKPACIVSDNGTEFTSRAILKWAGDNDIDWHYIDPGKPLPEMVEHLSYLRAPRTPRLPKLTTKIMKPNALPPENWTILS